MRLATKLLALFTAVSVLPLLLLGAFAYVNLQDSLRDEQLEHLNSVSSLKAERVSTVIEDNVRILLVAAARDDVGAAMQTLSAGPDADAAAALDLALTETLAAIQPFVAGHALDTDGRVVASSMPGALGQSWAGDDRFEAGRETARSDFMRLTSEGQLLQFVSGPVNHSGQFVGVLVMEKIPQTLLDVTAQVEGLGQTGETMVLRRADNGSALFLAPTRFDPDAALRRTAMSNDSLARRALDAADGASLEGVDYRGEDVVAFVHAIRGTEWVLLVKMDQNEVDLPVARVGGAIVALAIATFSIVAFVGVWLARSISGPLEELADTSAEIVSGDLARRARVQGDDELRLLSENFNRMANALIAGRVELEQRVRDRTAALERSNRELEQFAYVASHDLQEPLRSVAGFVQLLQRRYSGKIDAQADEYIKFAVEAVKRMQTLIQDLLVYSRVDTQGKALEPTDSGRVLADVESSLQASIQESGAELARDAMPVVMADPGQLGQLFQNLLSNALKFRAKDRKPVIKVSARRDGAMWQFAVQDNGIGIDRQYRDKIFVIFQRLHGREEYPGTGIGLSVCKRIVERHGGRIWVESSPGQGSTFLFTLPATPDQLAKDVSEEEEPPRPRTLRERGDELV